MSKIEDLKAEAKRLQAEVTEKMADPIMTGAQKAEFLDKASAANDEIAVGIKNLQRAQSFMAANDSTPDPVEVKAAANPYAELDATFKQMAAMAKMRAKGDFVFDLGLKAQGATNLMGEAATGTTAPSALAGGSYFLTGNAGPSIPPQFLPGIVENRFYPLTVADLFGSISVSSPVVTYVAEASWTNNSAAVAEGATKPYSTQTITRLTEQVGKVANLAKVTDEMIQDAPYFWSLVQRRLPMGVRRELEVQLLAGTGMPGVNGLLNRTTGFTQATGTLPAAVTNFVVPAASTPGAAAIPATVTSVQPGRQIKGTGAVGTPPTAVQIAEGILQAMNDIRFKVFFEPDSIVMNPLDWYTIRIAKDGQGQYLGGSFFGHSYGGSLDIPIGGAVDSALTLWNKRVITTPVIPQGYILIGDFADAGSVLRLGGLSVATTNYNATDFEQNLWTVRAEERAGLLVERPNLFEFIQLANA